jgi:hypothetical protein
VDFAIRAERGNAVKLDGQFVVLQNFARAEAGRDAVSDREIIEPHHHMMEEINKHDARDFRVGKRAEDAAATLFDNPDTSFNFANVFGSRRGVEGSIDVIANFFEFVIHEDGVNIETRTSICTHDPMK